MNSILNFSFGKQKPQTSAEARRVADALKEESAGADRLYDAAKERYGDEVMAATSPADLVRLAQKLGELEQDRDRKRAALNAVLERVGTLQSLEADAENRRLWSEVQALGVKRSAAHAQLVKAAGTLAKAFIDAEDAGAALYQAMPLRSIAGSPLAPDYCDLGGELDLLLSLRSDGRIGSVRDSSLWELRRKPGLLERAADQLAYWLSHAPQGEDAPPKEAA